MMHISHSIAFLLPFRRGMMQLHRFVPSTLQYWIHSGASTGMSMSNIKSNIKSNTKSKIEGCIALYWWCLVLCGVVHYTTSSNLVLFYNILQHHYHII